MTYPVEPRARPLLAVLQEIPDFRKAQGKRHPLPAILGMACAATLCGYRGYSAIAEWGRNYGAELAAALGFTHQQTPCVGTLHTIFTTIDSDLLDAKVGEWAEGILVTLATLEDDETGLEGVAVDGKTLRGSRKQGASYTHLLSAVSHRLGLPLGQEAVSEKTNEIPVMQDLLKNLMIDGRVFTMDALLTQREIAQTIVDGGGHYVMIAKENQPNLLRDIKDVFAESQLLADTLAETQTLDVGHGRIEKRHIVTSTALVDYSDWPGLQQVFQLTRTVTHQVSGKRTSEIVYGLSSLPPQLGSPDTLLTFSRQHWHIENKSHWVRDVTFDEDRSQVRTARIHQVMATLRNAAIGLMRAHGDKNIAAACRRFAARPHEALALLGVDLEN